MSPYMNCETIPNQLAERSNTTERYVSEDSLRNRYFINLAQPVSNEETCYIDSNPTQSIVLRQIEQTVDGHCLSFISSLARDSFVRILKDWPHYNIDSRFLFVNRIEFLSFIKNNLDLLPILNKAYDQIQNYFPSTDVYLKISYEYDAEVEQKELTAIIKSEFDVENTFERLDQFRRHWWYRNIDKTFGQLLIRV